MKLKLVIFVMLLAAMGPGRDAEPVDPDSVRQVNPARLPPVSAQPTVVPDAPKDAPSPNAFEVLDGNASTPSDFIWNARPVVIFADTPDDPAFTQQIEALRRDSGYLAGRDVVVIVDSDPAANSAWRRQLRPQGFSLVLIDKDGQVKIRRPSPWDVRDISRAIDRLPLRRQEVGQSTR